jgi:cell division protein FtsQ
VELPDLASRRRLIAGQRVNSHRVRKRVARRARLVASRVAVALAVAAVLGGAAFGANWAVHSPRFSVASIEVNGQARLGRDEIVTAAGIAPGVNLFAVDPRAVVTRLETLPLIRHAEVIRSLPNRITVFVEERRPFTVVHAGRLHWIDEEGVDLGVEPRAVALAAPVLSGLEPVDLAGEGRTHASERAVLGIALVRLLLRAQSSLLGQISEIDLSRPEGPVLYTVDGVEVRLGREEWEARLGRLQGVLAQLGSSGETATSIDLRFRDQVVLRNPVK